MSLSVRFVLKESLRKLPIVGWFMESSRYLFLNRSWQKDEPYVREMVNFEMRTSAVHTFIIFPEGTDLSPSNIAKSQEYALVTGLPVFNNVLNPRTTGLVALKNMIGSERIESILDLTLAYTLYSPGERPEEMSLINGRPPRKVHLLVREWPMRPTPNQVMQTDTVTINELNKNMMTITNNSDDAITPSDDVGLSAWVVARFIEKEQLLGQFYLDDTVGFNRSMVQKVLGPAVTTATYDEDMEILLHPERRKLQRCIEQIGEWNALYALVFWVVCSTYSFFWYGQIWTYLIVSTLIIVGVSRLSKQPGGIQRTVFLTAVPARAALWPRIVARVFASRRRSSHRHRRKHSQPTIRIAPTSTIPTNTIPTGTI